MKNTYLTLELKGRVPETKEQTEIKEDNIDDLNKQKSDILHKSEFQDFIKEIDDITHNKSDPVFNLFDLPETENSFHTEIKPNPALRTVKLSSNFILPLDSLSLDFTWRENLKPGDKIDIFELNNWFLGTVLSVCDYCSVKSVKIGFRLYSKKGNNEDLEFRIEDNKFFNWSQNIGHKIYSVHDPKLRR